MKTGLFENLKVRLKTSPNAAHSFLARLRSKLRRGIETLVPVGYEDEDGFHIENADEAHR